MVKVHVWKHNDRSGSGISNLNTVSIASCGGGMAQDSDELCAKYPKYLRNE
jgi:hypothetical protein